MGTRIPRDICQAGANVPAHVGRRDAPNSQSLNCARRKGRRVGAGQLEVFDPLQTFCSRGGRACLCGRLSNMGRGQLIWTSEVPDESLTLSPWVKGSPIWPLPIVTQQKV